MEAPPARPYQLRGLESRRFAQRKFGMVASEAPSLMGQTATYTVGGAAGGFVMGAIESAWKPPHPTAPFTHSMKIVGNHAGGLAAVAAVFGLADASLHMVNGSSPANQVVAGCLAGSLPGLKMGNAQLAVGGCAGFALMQAVGALCMRDELSEH